MTELQSLQNWRFISSFNPVYGIHGNWQIQLLWHLDPENDATQKLVPVVIVTQVRTLNFTLHRLLDVEVFFR